MIEINFFNNKYRIVNDNYNNQCIEIKKEWNEYIERVNKLERITINNLLTYCKSKNRFIIEYKKYTYHLEQNLDEVILSYNSSLISINAFPNKLDPNLFLSDIIASLS